MNKRLFDIFISFFGLLFFSPILIIVIFLIWIEDKKSPFYITQRLGKGEKQFNMIKLRSMLVDADKSGVVSSSNNDMRITPIGHKIRKYKLDEFIQLWNVLNGDMSLVGPRPNVKDETDLYTDIEKKLLLVRPGITDFSSIVFSDEGEILEGKENPNLTYNQLIRPWKSRLGLIYINNQSFLLDIKIIIHTLVAIFSRQRALNWVVSQLKLFNVDSKVVKISKREQDLYPFPPPGSDKVVIKR
ncbi:MAG: sugar transferase [Pelagibacteraceae bacterium]|nr:sugar transferase [Pelagibacteraceae bacterium]MBT6354461.1 sugar transferase [Pelagibacteraceae bacterium]|tara:strand:+ start:1003 stop:1731 length:729 start_codon:yes stop_codon:yes gene_type:complete